MPRLKKNMILSILIMAGATVSFIQNHLETNYATERKSRLKRMYDKCSKSDVLFSEARRLGGASPSFMKPKHFQYFIVDDVNRILYCYVSKAGNSHWKALMAVLGGAVKDRSRYQYQRLEDVPVLTGSVIHEPSFFRKLSDFKMIDILERIEDPSYKIFTFVRHPYSRILSAYKDKFSLKNTIVRKKYDRLYGDYIFTKYQNEDASEAEEGYKVSWQAFARYLADPGIKDMNEHWELQYKICNPCHIPFDVVGKVENANVEAAEIINYLSTNFNKTVKMEVLRYLPAYPNSVDAKMLKKYFSILPKSVLDGLYARYKMDFEIFGYDPNIF